MTNPPDPRLRAHEAIARARASGDIGQYRPHPQYLSAKGPLAAGSDADIVVWDPAANNAITAKRQLSRIDYNVFEGFVCLGAPVVTVSRGRIAWANGELRAEKGDGQYIERPAFSPVHVANSTWKQAIAPQGVRRADATP